MKKLLVALAAVALAAPAAWADSEFSIVLQGGASHYTQSLASGSACFPLRWPGVF